jgi:hypothetical protein
MLFSLFPIHFLIDPSKKCSMTLSNIFGMNYNILFVFLLLLLLLTFNIFFHLLLIDFLY